MSDLNDLGRRKDTHSRDRIDEIARNYSRFIRISITLWVALTAVLFGLGVLDTWLTIQNSQRIADNTQLGERIQDQRRLKFLDDCKTTNSRHDNAVHVLLNLNAENRRRNPKAGRFTVKQTITLINAIVPKQNCKKVLQTTVGIP